MTTVFILRVSYLLTYNGMITSVYIIAIFIPPNIPAAFTNILSTCVSSIWHIYRYNIDNKCTNGYLLVKQSYVPVVIVTMETGHVDAGQVVGNIVTMEK